MAQGQIQIQNFNEIGRTGLNRWGGQVQEEFLRELQGTRGMKIYREMSTNDAVIGAILFAFEYLARQVSWTMEPATGENRDKERADLVWGALNDMNHSWNNTLSEIFSMLVFGWAWFEIVLKRRQGDQRDAKRKSKFNDNKIGWRKWAIRAQETIHEWKFDDEGGIQAMVQMAAPDFQIFTIPIEKSLLFRTSIHRNNPEGKSLLRGAYRSWFFKKRIEEIEGIGIERDLAGLPQIIPPSNYDLWNSNDPKAVAMLAKAEKMVRSIRRDEQEGIVLPNGWEIKLLSTGGRRQFDTNAIITRYDQRMAMSVLADFILIGHEQVGSFALSSSKTHLFAVALGSILDSIADVVNNHAVPTFLRLNGEPTENPPLLKHGDIESADLAAIGEFVAKLSAAGIDLTDESTVKHLRDQANLPEPPEEDEDEKARRLEEEGALDQIMVGMEQRIKTLESKNGGAPQGGE